MALGELQRLEELLLAERADQEMGGARPQELIERFAVVARKQDKQGRGIGLGGIAERAYRLSPSAKAPRASTTATDAPEATKRLSAFSVRRAAIGCQPARSAMAVSSSRWRKDRMKSGAAPPADSCSPSLSLVRPPRTPSP